MTVIINLSVEAEAKLRQQAGERGIALEEFLSDLATRWARDSVDTSLPDAKTAEQRVKDWHAFVASHDHVTAVADDSRESIYDGCGE
jgi:hypothetical protein